MNRDAPLTDFKFRLYVAGDAQNSVQAIANLRALGRAHLPDHCEIEVFDVFKDAQRALSEAVFMTPTLIKYSPGALRRLDDERSVPVRVVREGTLVILNDIRLNPFPILRESALTRGFKSMIMLIAIDDFGTGFSSLSYLS